MRATVFVGTSVDGFIARLNGEFDFLPPGGGEEHGYTAFMESVDALVLGRGTFETVLKFEQWPYGEKRVVVLSSRPLDFALARQRGGVASQTTRSQVNVEQMSGDPREIVARLDAEGVQHAYIDGGVTIQRFLRAGLIQRVIITRVPVLIGTGIPLFGVLDADVRLEHVATRSYASGLVQSEYTVLG